MYVHTCVYICMYIYVCSLLFCFVVPVGRDVWHCGVYHQGFDWIKTKQRQPKFTYHVRVCLYVHTYIYIQSEPFNIYMYMCVCVHMHAYNTYACEVMYLLSMCACVSYFSLTNCTVIASCLNVTVTKIGDSVALNEKVCIMYTHAHTHTLTHTHTHTHARAHTHTHTHTRTLMRNNS